MRIDAAHIIAAIAMSIGAVLVMDSWNVMLKKLFGIPSLDYCMLGRWLLHMPGRFRHASISAAPRKSKECAAGWVAHYSIGVSLAVAFVLLVSGEWLTRPTLLPALLYGITTVAFPFLIMQPALGLGIASSKSATPTRARLKSLTTHAVYGAGLYLCALGMMMLRAVL